MIANNLINQIIPPLKLTDTANKALSWMGHFHVQHLPIVHERQYRELISEYDILDANRPDQPFGEYLFEGSQPHVETGTHIYEVIKQINHNKLTLIPVLNKNGLYIGCITTENLLNFFAKTNALQEPGGIIILEMATNSYVLSEIAHLIEDNGAKIMSLYVNTSDDEAQLEVTLKVNRTDLSSITQTLERFRYNIKEVYQEEGDYYEDVQDHYNSLMNYLNM